MHRTLKAETTRPPAGNRTAQQRRFNIFREEFNHERPHEALGMNTPAGFYEPSPRPMPSKLPPLDYPGHFEVRYVSFNGGIRWKRDWVNISIVAPGSTWGSRRSITVSGTSTLALSNSAACSKNTCGSKMPMESSSAEIQSPLKAMSARRSHSHLKGPVYLWITSLLPTYPQPCKLSRSTKEPQGGAGIDIKV